MAYKIIDMNTYVRKEHFSYFRSLPYPYVGLTVDVDVTRLLERCRKQESSFYLCFMHLAALAADEVPQFRQRTAALCRLWRRSKACIISLPFLGCATRL